MQTKGLDWRWKRARVKGCRLKVKAHYGIGSESAKVSVPRGHTLMRFPGVHDYWSPPPTPPPELRLQLQSTPSPSSKSSLKASVAWPRWKRTAGGRGGCEIASTPCWLNCVCARGAEVLPPDDASLLAPCTRLSVKNYPFTAFREYIEIL